MQQNNYLNSINLNTNTNFPYLVLNVDNGQMQPLTKGFRIAHWHEDLQFTYVRKGILNWQTLDNCLTLQKGEAILFNSKVVHLTKADSTSAYTNILFPSFFLGFYPTSPVNSLLTQFIGNPSLPYLILKRNIPWQKEIIKSLQFLIQLEKNPCINYQYRVLLQLNQIWLTISENCQIPKPRQTNKTQQRMEQFIHFLHEHYNENFNINDLAATAYVSKAECLRCFHTSLNTTPYQYLLELRIAKASEFLRNTNKTITEIANLVGFNQISNFGKVFKERMTHTPSEYRKNIKHSNANFNSINSQ